MIDLKRMEVWFVTGSQHLYGPETLKQVAAHSREIAGALDAASAIPVKVLFKQSSKHPKKYLPFASRPTKRPDVSGW